jgi:hypothetical protein
MHYAPRVSINRSFMNARLTSGSADPTAVKQMKSFGTNSSNCICVLTDSIRYFSNRKMTNSVDSMLYFFFIGTHVGPIAVCVTRRGVSAASKSFEHDAAKGVRPTAADFLIMLPGTDKHFSNSLEEAPLKLMRTVGTHERERRTL